MKTVNVLGTPLQATNYTELIAYCRQLAEKPTASAVEFSNTHVVAMARHERAFRAVIGQFDLVAPDGMPLVWCMNRQLAPEQRLTDRVYGPNFMLQFFAATADDPGARHFLLGGPLSLLERLRSEMAARFPGLQIAGIWCPPFREWGDAEDGKICAAIRECGARFIWVGLGCPKQECWIARNRSRLPDGVYFSVGAAFAFHAGLVAQAPQWMQDRGLEWLYRVCTEPRRLWKRYLLFNVLFVFYLCRDRFLGTAIR